MGKSDIQNERRCLYCEKLVEGRRDKRFCDHHCRSAYHADRRREEDVIIRKVNKILRCNREILKHLNVKEKTRIGKAELKWAGYAFEYFTSVYTTTSGVTYHYCYDHGYRELGDDEVLLVRNYQLK